MEVKLLLLGNDSHVISDAVSVAISLASMSADVLIMCPFAKGDGSHIFR